MMSSFQYLSSREKTMFKDEEVAKEGRFRKQQVIKFFPTHIECW